MALKVWPPEELGLNSYLKLEQNANGNIVLAAVDQAGNNLKSNSILVITPEGRLRRVTFCEAPGIVTEGQGRIAMCTFDPTPRL